MVNTRIPQETFRRMKLNKERMQVGSIMDAYRIANIMQPRIIKTETIRLPKSKHRIKKLTVEYMFKF